MSHECTKSTFVYISECNKSALAYIHEHALTTLALIFILCVGLTSGPSFGASNYSVVGVTAKPAMAHAGTSVSITFSVNASTGAASPHVAVTVNGNAVTNVIASGANPKYVFSCTYTVRSTDPDGNATVSVFAGSGTDSPAPQVSSNVLLVDNTAPFQPAVTDDGAFTSSTSLHATWPTSDPQTGVIAYQYAVGTKPGGTDVVKWTTPTLATTVSNTTAPLALVAGKTYYISAMAENGVGLWSTVGTSDGIIFDNTTPTKPIVTDDGANTTNVTRLHASWSSSAPSGIAEYRYAIGTSPTDVGSGYLIPWTSAGTQTQATVSNLQLHSGWTYYFYVKARNAVGNWSGVGVSDGIEAGVQLVARDFLAGISDFAWSPETQWYSDYTRGDFSILPNNEWIEQEFNGKIPAGWWGFDSPATNDTVAVGWNRYSNQYINPATSIECDLADASSVFGSGQTGKCQYFALKNIPSVAAPSSALAGLFTRYSLPINNKDAYRLHANDRITFTLDLVQITGVNYLPSNTWVHFDLTIFTGPNWVQTNYRIPYNATTASVSVTIPSSATWVLPYLYIGTNGNLGTSKPGIYIKGAHIAATRGGSQIATESQPCQKRTIKTGIYGYQSLQYDPSYVGANCDWVTFWTSPDAPLMAEQLRKTNPNIKACLYESSNLQKEQDSPGHDIWHLTTIPFGSVSTSWLYSNGHGGYRTHPDWPVEYFTQFANPTFQSAWANAAASMLAQYHMDGLFIDTCNVVTVGTPAPTGVLPPGSDNPNPNGGRLAWECQSFIHHVVPLVRSVTWTGEQTPRRIHVMQNADQVNIAYPQSDPNYCVHDPYDLGSVAFNPGWSGAGLYTSNKIANTPDAHFNEQCFWYGGEAGTRNNYNSGYWLRCLNDMDQRQSWNAGISSSDDCKWLHCQALGADRSDGPAIGVDGWINFALCSYLLGQNNWTTLVMPGSLTTYQDSSVYIYPNYDITMDYPTPAGKRYQAGSASPYFLARDYYGDDGGARGGTVLANGDTTAAHSCTALSDVVDQANTYYPYGSTIQIAANKGRMFFNPSSYRYVSVILTPAQNQTLSAGSYTVAGYVKKNRAGIAYPSDVQIQIDGGAWIDRPVDSQSGCFFYVWPATSGTHTISSRVYVSATDYEPEKPVHVCTCH